MKHIYVFTALVVSNCFVAAAQVTTGSLGGLVKAVSGERLSGATVQLTHEATAARFFSQTNRQGLYHVDNLPAGGPYTLSVLFIGFTAYFKQDIYLTLGETTQLDVSLQPEFKALKELVVEAGKKHNGTNFRQLLIDRERLSLLTASGKNISDYLFYLPQARMIASTEGAVSFAGQNNRYNAFFIDGAINNDVFGLAASGTNGGQAGLSPVPVEAIEQLQVNITPYDASIGNFTGAAVNAITRSGGNREQTSVYHFFSNRSLPEINDTVSHPKDDYHYQLYGVRWQGPVKRNRCFFFLNAELIREATPHFFTFDHYQGNLATRELDILANSLRGTYRYDAGSYLGSADQLYAAKAVLRIDWNLSAANKFVFAARYMDAAKTFGSTGTPETIHFSHDGFSLKTRTISVSGEWRRNPGAASGNKFMITYTTVQDNRGPDGKPFPRVRIYDGDASVVFGTDNSSTTNLLVQHNFTLQEQLHWSPGRHLIRAGIDADYSRLKNAFIQHSFGSYSYASLGDFLSNAHPSGYQLGFLLTDSLRNDHSNAAIGFNMLRLGFFLKDEYRISTRFTVGFGLRADYFWFPDKSGTNNYFNDSVLPVLSHYYETGGAKTGQSISIPVSISPRLYFQYGQSTALSIQGGLGLFRGRLPLAWPGGIYQMDGLITGGFIPGSAQLNKIRFRPDVNRQWLPYEFGATTNKDPVNLVTRGLHMPSLLRSSISIAYHFRNGWRMDMEAVLSKNLYSITYTNINLLPPTDHVNGPDQRPVYSAIDHARVPLVNGAANPFDYVILLGNHQNAGYAWEFSASLRKLLAPGSVLELAHHYSSSRVIADGTNSVNVSQWRAMETVGGRNNPSLSQSDFSAGHKLSVWLSTKWKLAGMDFGAAASYCGQSGTPFSYVYQNSLTRDDGKASGYDLLYIPGPSELAGMEFLANTIRGMIYSPEQQKTALEEFIRSDSYLASRRGQYAERNGSRTPFSHSINLKLTVNKKLFINKKGYFLEYNFELRNALNLLNRNQGWQYLLPNDQLQLIEFAGFRSMNDFTPLYKFDPSMTTAANKWKPGSSVQPGYASFWTCLVGCKIIW